MVVLQHRVDPRMYTGESRQAGCVHGTHGTRHSYPEYFLVWSFFHMSKCLIWMRTRKRFVQYQSTKHDVHVFMCPCAGIVFTRRTLVV